MVEKARLTTAIACKDISKAFGAKAVLKGVSCSVAHGEVLAVMGRSGSGKSTFLRMLALLEQADNGDAWVMGAQYIRHGDPVIRPVDIRRRIALVFQQFNLFPNLTVLENCTLGPIRALKKDVSYVNREAIELLGTLGLEAAIFRYPETLSGGEAQRVALARALLMRPEVLLLDEVTSSLDPESIFTVLKTIRSIRSTDQGKGLTIILITHLLRFAQTFATTIAYLHDGQFVDILPASSFCDQAASSSAKAFIEQAQADWIVDE